MAENPSMLEEAGALNCVEDYHDEDTTSSITSCGCLRGLLYCWWRAPHRYKSCEGDQEAVKLDHQKWLKELKIKVRVLSKTLVGPRGKAIFMRRLKTWRGKKKKERRMQFQYDAKSYALNFDDGIEKKEGEEGLYLDFSARFACPLGTVINKQYLGLGAL